MIITIASGKGGTGKTTVAINLALALSSARSEFYQKGAQLLDCDIEEPNSHIFIRPEIKEKKPVFIPVPEVDEGKCNLCGTCQKMCAYNAIAVVGQSVLVFSELCHGCGVCSYVCPQEAIIERKKEIGWVEIGKKGELQFVHGRLNLGGTISPPVIREVKRYIREGMINIIDAPPGTSCSVIESVKGSDYCILVTEPTPFGLNDLALAVELMRELKIPCGVVINMADVGDEKVEIYCREQGLPILMRIPFDRKIALLYSKGIPLVAERKEYIDKFLEMFDLIVKPTGKEW